MEHPAGSRPLRPHLEGDEDHLQRVLPPQPAHIRSHMSITPPRLSSGLQSLIIRYGPRKLEALAAMLETTVDDLILRFLP